jgi:hypothetical protein
LLSRPVQRLLVQLPVDAENAQFDWNGRELSADESLEDADAPGQFRLAFPPSEVMGGASTQRLVIRYSQPAGRARWDQGRQVGFPVFPSGVWIDQTWWELTLPPSQHLFVPPATMSPQFHWKREWVYWQRRANAEFQEIKSSILGHSFTDARRADRSGNTYAFMSLGPREAVRFSSLSKSLVVFFGAGLTFTLSFLLLKVPSVRHPLFWLAAGLCLTAASLWYLEPVLLLLQPAVFGLILPICAALLDYVTNGRRPVVSAARPFLSDRDRFGESGSGFAGQGLLEAERTPAQRRTSAISDSGLQS